MAISKLRPRISHAEFAVVFPILLYSICNALNIDKLTKWFTQKAGVDYVALSAYLVAGLCLFIAFFVLLAHRRTIKPLAIVIVILSTAATYFISKYNVAIDSSMILNVAHTDSTEVRQLLSPRMLPFIVLLMIVPVAFILTVDITFQPLGRYLIASLKLFSVTVLVALLCLYSNYNAVHRAGNISNKYIVYSLVPINFISASLSAASKTLQPYLRLQQAEVKITGRVDSHDDLIVVLVIGESSRRKNFSLYGYDRLDTNPALRKVAGLHLLNGIAKRGTTLYALPQILEKADIKLTSIVSALGIPTSCYVNYTLYDNCASVGETKVSNCRHGTKCYDEDVLPLLENALRTYDSGQRFVVLHLGGGSHGPVYSARHPTEFQLLRPMCTDADVANECSLEQIYNSYDNTILYADYVLGEIVQRLDRSGTPYVFIYLSDHGESLMDEGRMFHGMPPGVALPSEQAEIPLIVKSSIPISILKRAEYQQQDVFDTVLELFSIRTPLFDSSGAFIKKRTASGPKKIATDGTS
jgi:lipid A ethanolaminephosphotransferase